jgi:hypothetical protein
MRRSGVGVAIATLVVYLSAQAHAECGLPPDDPVTSAFNAPDGSRIFLADVTEVRGISIPGQPIRYRTTFRVIGRFKGPDDTAPSLVFEYTPAAISSSSDNGFSCS